jgi:hypothetical protein
METDNFNNLIKNNLFKIFLFGVIIMLLIDTRHKFIFLLFFIIGFIVYKEQNNLEKFSESLIEKKNNNKTEPIKLNYGHKYDIIKIDEITNKLVYLCKYYEQINKTVKTKLVDIYKEIRQNDELKKYLKFINLVDNNGDPLFINESPDVSLFNQIKILLVTLPQKEL